MYHTFSTLQPLLSSAGGRGVSRSSSHEVGESGGIMKMLGGGVKLSTPVVELMVHAVESIKILCEDVSRREGVAGMSHLTPQGLDVVGGVYSGGECVEMLLNYLPLFRDLFSVIMATFKKIQSHVSIGMGFAILHWYAPWNHYFAQVVYLTGSDDHSHKDRHENSLKFSNLEKFTDGGVSDVGGAYIGDDDGSEMYSPSPVSTVSSSGEVGGVYTLYSDAMHSEDDKDLSGKKLFLNKAHQVNTSNHTH